MIKKKKLGTETHTWMNTKRNTLSKRSQAKDYIIYGMTYVKF